MASEKMSPILAILHELKRHCESSKGIEGLMNNEQNPLQQQALQFGWQCENTSIATLYDLLKITAIPDKERNAVITAVSELAAMKGCHFVLSKLLKDLKRP